MDAFPLGLPFTLMMFVFPLVYLAVLVFIIAMVLRLVRGVERIAEALERK
jgi:hypothetical protein